MSEQIELSVADMVQYVRNGGSLTIFTPNEIKELQRYATSFNDERLNTYLNKFWKGV